jgi:hypothetical protein
MVTDTSPATRIFSPNPLKALMAIRDDWIGQQAAYHARNAASMASLDKQTERWSSVLGWWAIGVVLLDLGLAGIEISGGLLPRWRGSLEDLAPWLIFISAVVPAMVTALGGLRFQSECRRLAQRSAFMHRLLNGGHAKGDSRWDQADSLLNRMRLAKKDPHTDIGSWTHDALRFTERLAEDFANETAEWSVLYSKELPDQG